MTSQLLIEYEKHWQYQSLFYWFFFEFSNFVILWLSAFELKDWSSAGVSSLSRRSEAPERHRPTDTTCQGFHEHLCFFEPMEKGSVARRWSLFELVYVQNVKNAAWRTFCCCSFLLMFIAMVFLQSADELLKQFFPPIFEPMTLTRLAFGILSPYCRCNLPLPFCRLW